MVARSYAWEFNSGGIRYTIGLTITSLFLFLSFLIASPFLFFCFLLYFTAAITPQYKSSKGLSPKGYRTALRSTPEVSRWTSNRYRCVATIKRKSCLIANIQHISFFYSCEWRTQSARTFKVAPNEVATIKIWIFEGPTYCCQ